MEGLAADDDSTLISGKCHHCQADFAMAQLPSHMASCKRRVTAFGGVSGLPIPRASATLPRKPSLGSGSVAAGSRGDDFSSASNSEQLPADEIDAPEPRASYPMPLLYARLSVERMSRAAQALALVPDTRDVQLLDRAVPA